MKNLKIDFSKLSDKNMSKVVDIFVDTFGSEFIDLTKVGHEWDMSCKEVPPIGKYTWDYMDKDCKKVSIRLTHSKDSDEDSYDEVAQIVDQLKDEGHAVTDIFIQNSILIEGGVTSI